MKIMVTGATGGYGSYAIPFIREFAPDAEVYGIARNESKASDLERQGIIPRIADYSDVDSLVRAFEGMERLLFISVSVHELQINVVKAAKLAGVQFIAYTSIAGIENNKFPKLQ
ncbi:MAG: NAD(P)H-binding protein [Eubacteriales bacterium]|nr:NAD(P)H-binding protein [Eubacteriales bacterium]